MKILVFLYVISSNGNFVIPEPFTGPDAWDECREVAERVEFMQDDMLGAYCLHVVQQ